MVEGHLRWDVLLCGMAGSAGCISHKLTSDLRADEGGGGGGAGGALRPVEAGGGGGGGGADGVVGALLDGGAEGRGVTCDSVT